MMIRVPLTSVRWNMAVCENGAAGHGLGQSLASNSTWNLEPGTWNLHTWKPSSLSSKNASTIAPRFYALGSTRTCHDLNEPTAASALDFCLHLVKATAPYAAAFKPNAAFFEVFGAEGWTALKQVIDAIQEESNRLGSHIPVILDAKRGDIASTAEAYAKSAFENLGADCITLSARISAKTSIEPFIRNPEKGVFLLCKTSNPGAGDLQDLVLATGEIAACPYCQTGANLEHQK